MLQLEDVHTYYGNIHALKGVSISIPKGGIVCLIGANGAGKSTTLMTIFGIQPAAKGKIFYDSQPIEKLQPEQIAARGVAQSPEGRQIFPTMSVRENLEMGAYLRSDKKEIAKDMEWVFTLFPRLAERLGQLGGTLSGGEQQMLAIARALMQRPKLLLLDEPSLGLAPKLVEVIFETITQINQDSSTTIFLVEQNANMALGISDTGYVMETGKIVLTDKSSVLLESEQVKKAYLG
ncbi:MAG: ABC transporter ATP-binding protein [Deltaproteobacteria bacterium]|nr:ABC transporter ATP-binding protein [Deltaproteobacteria bacterium]